MLRSALVWILVVCAASAFADSEPPAEYRAWWVDTFNTPFGTHEDVDRIVDAAAQSNANALFVEVRRRADAWYLDSIEPLTEEPGFGEPDATGLPTFDPLRDLIAKAHARNIEVHAFTIIGAIYREDPAERLPRDSNHVFLQHVWDAQRKEPYRDSRQWATRVLPHNAAGTSYDGQRFGFDWYIDLGHPDAASYTISVLTHLVREYDLDGIHLDRIRYPEAPVDRGGGVNVGYNATSVARFNNRFGRSGTPATNDPQWNEWRREQVTAFVRRLYLNVKAIRPGIRVSAAVICFGSGPEESGGFERTEAYWRVFQDWKGWTEEGLLDLIAPMNYKREHIAKQAAQFDDWMRFTARLARSSGRLSVIGLGAFTNSIEATLRQARRVRAEGANGVVLYSRAGTNTAISSNPYSFPVPNQPTGRRPDADVFTAFRTLKNAEGTARFAPLATIPLFQNPRPTPRLTDTSGHIMGAIEGADGLPVTIEKLDRSERWTIETDGSGFFGLAHLEPGTYRVYAPRQERLLQSCTVPVAAATVSRAVLSEASCLPPMRRPAAFHP